jgi:hypothetical protein
MPSFRVLPRRHLPACRLLRASWCLAAAATAARSGSRRGRHDALRSSSPSARARLQPARWSALVSTVTLRNVHEGCAVNGQADALTRREVDRLQANPPSAGPRLPSDSSAPFVLCVATSASVAKLRTRQPIMVPVVVRPPPSWQLKMRGSVGAAARIWRANSSKSRSCTGY